MTNVTKEEYWTTILNDPTQIGQITTEDTEFNRRINDVNLVLSNTFINSSDENLISKWETSLYIDGIEGKTITERKADILYTLCEKNYVPVSIVKRFLLNLIGDENRFAVEFVKDENKLIVHTDRISDELLMEVSPLLESVVPQFIEVKQYNHNMEISWRDINKYAECESADAVKAVNEDYKNDLTSDKWWVYNLTSLKRAYRLFEGSPIEFFEGDLSSMNDGDGMFISTKIKKFNTPMPSLTTCSGMFLACRYLESFDCNLDKLKMGGTMFFGAKLRSFKNALPIMTNGFQMFKDNPLEVFEVELPYLSNGGHMFDMCKLNKASALRVLNSIPAHASGEHLLDIGIHVDHQQDEEVLTSIANAEAKGWTLTVQWNGTPTSAASTMAMGSLIYAKVGEYELPDGTTERVLDWGHYVTNTEGYETFRSLESAYKYFNLEQPTEI